jgi:hypothetical protein
LETYDTSEHPPSKVGKRIRVAATSPLNANLSSANLDLLIETLLSWRRQIDIEKRSSIRNEVPFYHVNYLVFAAFCTLPVTIYIFCTYFAGQC